MTTVIAAIITSLSFGSSALISTPNPDRATPKRDLNKLKSSKIRKGKSFQSNNRKLEILSDVFAEIHPGKSSGSLSSENPGQYSQLAKKKSVTYLEDTSRKNQPLNMKVLGKQLPMKTGKSKRVYPVALDTETMQLGYITGQFTVILTDPKYQTEVETNHNLKTLQKIKRRKMYIFEAPIEADLAQVFESLSADTTRIKRVEMDIIFNTVSAN